jgi:hypothetical protein
MNIQGIRRKRGPDSLMSIRKLDHNSSRRNFRRAKHALAYGAAALLGVYATAIGTASWFPANAQTITLDTDCKTYKVGEIGADTLCVIEQNRLATLEKARAVRENARATQENKQAHERLNRNLAEERKLDKDLAAIAKAKACVQEIALFKKRDPEGFNKLNLTPAYVMKYACEISEKLPRSTASAVPGPVGTAPSPAGG